MTSRDITDRLFELSDEQYKQFQSKLMPTVSSDKIIGVRTPVLRRFAAELWKNGACESFLHSLPHTYYEEDNLHAFLIEKISDFDECIDALDKFLPCVDNWATCDGMSPKIFKKHTGELYPLIKRWISSEHTYTVRFGIKTLMCHYANGNFSNEHLSLVASACSDEYYIKMAVAWYFATMLAYHYDETVSLLENRKLDKWTHNKTIQKAIESYRITEEHKTYLRELRIV